MQPFSSSKPALYPLCTILAILLGTGLRLAHAGTYHLIHVPGSSVTSANGINKFDQVVGFYISSQNHIQGYLLSDGKYTTIFSWRRCCRSERH
jgi:hypothetical protein